MSKWNIIWQKLIHIITVNIRCRYFRIRPWLVYGWKSSNNRQMIGIHSSHSCNEVLGTWANRIIRGLKDANSSTHTRFTNNLCKFRAVRRYKISYCSTVRSEDSRGKPPEDERRSVNFERLLLYPDEVDYRSSSSSSSHFPEAFLNRFQIDIPVEWLSLILRERKQWVVERSVGLRFV